MTMAERRRESKNQESISSISPAGKHFSRRAIGRHRRVDAYWARLTGDAFPHFGPRIAPACAVRLNLRARGLDLDPEKEQRRREIPFPAFELSLSGALLH